MKAVQSKIDNMTVFNTNDMKTDDIEEPNKLDSLLEELSTADEEECESCAI